MTDTEIIKALEFCKKIYCNGDCPLSKELNCMEKLSRNALDLIKRQQERIKALIAGQETLQKHFVRERDRIVEQLEEAAFQEDAPIYKGDVEIDSYLRLSKVIEIVKGVQNE